MPIFGPSLRLKNLKFDESMHSMEYNTQRNKLIIPEYGRNIQRMIEYAKALPTKEERNKAARAIIDVMGQLNPHLRDINDFTHKLWDHLFIISDFELDVDSPYPIPTRETFEEKPKPLKYPAQNIKYRHYGKIMGDMIQQAIEWPEGKEKEALIEMILNQLKKSYIAWNKDAVADDVIFDHLEKMSGGKLNLNRDMKLTHVQQDNQNYGGGGRNKKKRKGPKRQHHQKRNHKN